mgnify:CR=1 FL=1
MQAVNAAFMFLLAWLTWLKADRIWAYRDSTDVLRIVYGPFVYFMAGTLGLAGRSSISTRSCSADDRRAGRSRS